MATGRLIDYLGIGLFAALPVSIDEFTGTLAIYYATDTEQLFFWNGTAWVEFVGGGGGGGTVWGGITGTLADQTDLQAALDAKLSEVNWGDIGGTITDQTDLATVFDSIDTALNNLQTQINDIPDVQPADFAIFYPGKPLASALLSRIVLATAVEFVASLPGSQGVAAVASTGTATIDVRKNGASVGSVVFTASATATFVMASDTAFAAGDILSLHAPGSPDATLENISITLHGTRSI